MKNLKKLISVIIAVIMIVGSFATVSAADYKDVESTNSFYKAINVLSGLGIVNGDDEGNFNPDNDIKRSEMVALVCRAMGEEDIATASASNAFTDVAANHWAAGYIAWGVNRGIINGMGDGTFAPDASVSYQDAVVMIMRALGYDRIAQRAENGGYPTGYLKLASQYGVLKDAGFDNQAAAPRKVVAQLIFNSLTAPLVDVSSYGVNVEDDKYLIYNGKNGTALRTLLTYTNDVLQIKATVTGTPASNQNLIKDDGNKVALNVIGAYDYALVDVQKAMGLTETNAAFAVEIYAGDTDVINALGETVELYIAESEELNNWVVLACVASKTTVTETVSENILNFVADSSDFLFTYKENATDATSDAEEIEVAGTATLYVNGADQGTVEIGDAATIKGASSVTFMKDRADAKFTKIFVTKYQYKVVKEVFAEKARIKYEGAGSLNLDPEVRGDEKFFYNIYDADGRAITLEDVKAGDVLNILAPANGAIASAASLEIYVTSNIVEGTINGDSSVGSNYIYAIDGEEYKSASALTLGAQGKFYVSIDGVIIYSDTTLEINKNFALLSYIEAETKMGKTTYTLDLYTAEGNIETYELASSVRVLEGNEATAAAVKDAALDADMDVFEAMVKETVAGGEDGDDAVAAARLRYENRLITFKTDANGKISEIRKMGTSAGTDPIAKVAAAGSYTWDADFEEYKSLNASEAKILVPKFKATLISGSTYAVTIDEEASEIAAFTDLEDKDSYIATLYQTKQDNEDDIISIALADSAPTPGFAYSPLAVVKSVSSALDKDDNTVRSITFIQSGKVETLKVSYQDNSAVPTLASGDIFQYAKNAAGEMKKAQLILEMSDVTTAIKDPAEESPADLVASTNKYAFALGYIADMDDGIKLAADFTSDGTNITGFTGAKKIKLVEDATFTYAQVVKADANSVDRATATNASKIIDASEIEAADLVAKKLVALVKLNKDGRATDIVVIDVAAETITADLTY